MVHGLQRGARVDTEFLGQVPPDRQIAAERLAVKDVWIKTCRENAWDQVCDGTWR